MHTHMHHAYRHKHLKHRTCSSMAGIQDSPTDTSVSNPQLFFSVWLNRLSSCLSLSCVTKCCRVTLQQHWTDLEAQCSQEL